MQRFPRSRKGEKIRDRAAGLGAVAVPHGIEHDALCRIKLRDDLPELLVVPHHHHKAAIFQLVQQIISVGYLFDVPIQFGIVPPFLFYQREQVCCYNSSWADRWIDGIAEIMDTCHTDGVYLDGTSRLWSCANEAHGCGQRDADGNLHVTYPVHAVRRLFERLYREVHARGGIINVHSSGAPNFTALPFIDLLWCGEDLQFDYTKGKFGDVPLTYYQTVYTGLNTGVPVELIAYENRPVWKFENALACSLIHGFLPRPNDIAFPLELMSGIWDVFDSFPIRQSEWLPYWDSKGVLSVSDSHIRASVYRYTAPDGEKMYLLLCANVTKDDTAGAEIRFAETVRLALQMPEKQTYSVENSTLSVDLPAYTSKIFFLKS